MAPPSASTLPAPRAARLPWSGVNPPLVMPTSLGKKICKVDAETQAGRDIELDLAEDGTIVKKDI
jgi:hypothetical protein